MQIAASPETERRANGSGGGLTRSFEPHEFAPHRHRPDEAGAPCYGTEPLS